MFSNLSKRIQEKLSNEDNRIFMYNIVGNYCIKGAAIFVSMMMTPVYMSFFYSQKILGVWLTLCQLINYIQLFDFGVGGGMRNLLVRAFDSNDRKNIKEILSSAYFSIGIIVAILLVVVLIVVNIIDWYPILGLNYEDLSHKTLVFVMSSLAIGVICGMVTSLVSPIFYAMQKAIIPPFLILMSNISILLYMLIVSPKGNAIDLINLSIVQALFYNIPSLIAATILFKNRFKDVRPNIKFFRKRMVKNIISDGTYLFYIQITILLVFGVKEILISWLVNPEQVVEYNVYSKMIGVVGTLFITALTPVWSAVTKDYISNNFAKIHKLYLQGCKAIMFFILLQLLLLVMLPWLCKLWLGKKAIEVSFKYGAIYCVYNILYMWNMLNYNFACGMGRVKCFSICLTFTLCFSVLISYVITKNICSWIVIIVSTIIAIIPTSIIAPLNIMNFEKRRPENEQVK